MSLADDYRGAGLAGTLELGHTPALVLVDPAKAYTEPSSHLYAGVEEPVAVMRELLALCRAQGMPVVITRVEIKPDGSDAGVFWRKSPALSAFVSGNPLGDYIDGLEPREDELVVTKQYPSAFFGTDLFDALTGWRVDTLLVAGLSTSGCVRATAVDAMQHGFVPVVVKDAVGDRRPEVHEANLFDLQAKTAEVIPLSAVHSWLESLGPAD